MRQIDDTTAVGSAGERDTWSPDRLPPIGTELTHEQQLACAFRVLADAGFSEDLTGHITWVDRDDGSMLVNPWGLWWPELTASDVCRIDADGNQLSGRWNVTTAIPIHTELHRVRPDARVVIHNHPYYGVVLATLGMLPEILHQNASMFDGEMGLVTEYDGEIDDAQLGAELARRIGEASVVLLANHGVLVTGSTLEEAVYKSAAFERQCRLMVDVLLLDTAHTAVPAHVRAGLKRTLLDRAAPVYWRGAVRQLLRREPDVLD